MNGFTSLLESNGMLRLIILRLAVGKKEAHTTWYESNYELVRRVITRDRARVKQPEAGVRVTLEVIIACEL